MYGLNNAARVWNELLVKTFSKNRPAELESAPWIFIREDTVIISYIENMTVFAEAERLINLVEYRLRSKTQGKKPWRTKNCFGHCVCEEWEFIRRNETNKVDQCAIENNENRWLRARKKLSRDMNVIVGRTSETPGIGCTYSLPEHCRKFNLPDSTYATRSDSNNQNTAIARGIS